MDLKRIIKAAKCIYIAVSGILLFSSCNPDCEDITIQKAEWLTRYEDYYINKDTIEVISGYVDTLVSYSLVEHQTMISYKKKSDGELKSSTMHHYITVRNNNDTYSNRFAVSLSGKEYSGSSQQWRNLNKTTNYVSIGPKSTHTFAVSHPSWWRNETSGYNENNVRIKILQEPTNVYRELKLPKRVKLKRTRRIDKLRICDTVVNNCDCDVDALQERFEAVKDTYDRLKSENLISSY